MAISFRITNDAKRWEFGGRDDSETLLEELAGWKDQTNARFETNIFPEITSSSSLLQRKC
jgi:surfactin synthase thioesterase subunit